MREKSLYNECFFFFFRIEYFSQILNPSYRRNEVGKLRARTRRRKEKGATPYTRSNYQDGYSNTWKFAPLAISFSISFQLFVKSTSTSTSTYTTLIRCEKNIIWPQARDTRCGYAIHTKRYDRYLFSILYVPIYPLGAHYSHLYFYRSHKI